MHHLVANLGGLQKQKTTQDLVRLLNASDLHNASEEEIVRYIEAHQSELDELPTELLVALAEKLKTKRDGIV